MNVISREDFCAKKPDKRILYIKFVHRRFSSVSGEGQSASRCLFNAQEA